MPASVVFAQYDRGMGQGNAAWHQVPSQVWRGNWREHYAGISRKSEVLHHDDGKFKSPYAELSSQGRNHTGPPAFLRRNVTSTRRCCQQPTPPTSSPAWVVKTKSLTKDSWVNWKVSSSNDHLFDVYMGECVAPYVALDPLKAVLPVHRSTMTIPLNHDNCQGDKHNACYLDVALLHPTMQRRWEHRRRDVPGSPQNPESSKTCIAT